MINATLIDMLNWGNIDHVKVLDCSTTLSPAPASERYIKLTDIDRKRLRIFFVWCELPSRDFEIIEMVESGIYFAMQRVCRTINVHNVFVVYDCI